MLLKVSQFLIKNKDTFLSSNSSSWLQIQHFNVLFWCVMFSLLNWSWCHCFFLGFHNSSLQVLCPISLPVLPKWVLRKVTHDCVNLLLASLSRLPSDSRHMQLSASSLKFSIIWPLILPKVSTGPVLWVLVTIERSICPLISDRITPMSSSREGSISFFNTRREVSMSGLMIHRPPSPSKTSLPTLSQHHVQVGASPTCYSSPPVLPL